MDQKELIDLHKTLLEKCKKGDEKARYRLYKMYAKALYNSIYRIVMNSMDTEDLLQETFIKAFKNLNKLKDSKALFAWLKRIAVNEALSFMRSNKVSFVKIEHDVKEDREEDWSTVPIAMLQKEIKELPEGCRLVFNLFLLEDYSHKEIAEMLGVSESTSKTQYRRAKQLLQKKLKVYYEGG